MSRHHWDGQGFSTERVDSVRGGLTAVGWGVSLEDRMGGAGGLQAAGGGAHVLGRSLGRRGRKGAEDQGEWPRRSALSAGARWAPHVCGGSLDKVASPSAVSPRPPNSRADPQGLPPVSAERRETGLDRSWGPALHLWGAGPFPGRSRIWGGASSGAGPVTSLGDALPRIPSPTSLDLPWSRVGRGCGGA